MAEAKGLDPIHRLPVDTLSFCSEFCMPASMEPDNTTAGACEGEVPALVPPSSSES